jgi:hypothetical protein
LGDPKNPKEVNFKEKILSKTKLIKETCDITDYLQKLFRKTSNF